MDTPYLVHVALPEGVSEAIIFIQGYGAKNSNSLKVYQLWTSALRSAGWKGSIYHLWWDAAKLSNQIGTALRGGVGSMVHFGKHKIRARNVGKNYFPRILSDEISEMSFSLIAHSLGARVAYFIGRECSKITSNLKDMILLGGAIPKRRDWDRVAANVNGKLINVYNSNDLTLKTLFRASSLGLYPCGLKPIEDFHPRIVNIDATSLIGTSKHSSKHYLSVLRETVSCHLWG